MRPSALTRSSESSSRDASLNHCTLSLLGEDGPDPSLSHSTIWAAAFCTGGPGKVSIGNLCAFLGGKTKSEAYGGGGDVLFLIEPMVEDRRILAGGRGRGTVLGLASMVIALRY